MPSKIKLATIMSKYPEVPSMRVIRILADLNFHVSSSLNAEFTEEQAKVLENILSIETSASHLEETPTPKPKPQEQKPAKKPVVNVAKHKKASKKQAKKQIVLPKAPIGYDYPRVRSDIPYHSVKKKNEPHIFVVKKKDDDVHEKFIKQTLPGVFLPLTSYDAIRNAIKIAESRMGLDSNLLLHVYYHLEGNKILQKFFLDSIVEKYIKTKLLTKGAEQGSTYSRQLLEIYNAANNKESAFDIMKPKEFILNWNDVTFGHKHFTINPPKVGNIKFIPLTVQNDMSIIALNAIKEFLQERMPEIHCIAKENKLSVIDEIDLSNALRYLKIKSTKPALDPENDGLKEKRTVIPTINVKDFDDALSQASKFDKEELAKLKSKYINYLSSKQSDDYKVIPCNELMSYLSSYSTNTEPAFIFTLPSSKPNYVILAVENLNTDRSTMLFSFRHRHYERVLHSIFDYIQSYVTNKRSELRKWESYGLGGIEIEYHAVNHRSTEQYSWYEVLRHRLRTM